MLVYGVLVYGVLVYGVLVYGVLVYGVLVYGVLVYGVLSVVVDYLNLTLQINHMDNSSAWWQVNEYRKPNIFEPDSASNTYTWNSTIRIVTFNERVAPSILATVTSYGSVDLISLTCLYASRVSCRSFAC